jgi:hypothetical protein
MRNFALGITLGLLAAASIARTQEPAEQIQIGGTTVQIGMLKTAAISRIAEKGYQVKKVEEKGTKETWIAIEKGEHGDYNTIGELFLTDGRLTSASRTLSLVRGQEGAKLGRNLYFLVKSFEDSGDVSCTIRSGTQEAPELDHRWVSIQCGKRTATVHVTKYNEEQPSTSLDEAIE